MKTKQIDQETLGLMTLAAYGDAESIKKLVLKAKVKRAPSGWKCQECGKKMSLKAAERASLNGCPKCGGVDIDLT